ncbi:MAG: CheR family methyltransferase [Ferruginibacter sp.]
MPATKNKEKLDPPKTPQLFPIIGVGASAGGLDAFKRLLTAIPEQSGMAYVLVQHLSPTHESILPEILQRVTNIPVHEITDDIHLAPDHIYVIPSNKILTSIDGVLSLSPRENFKTNLPIDIFFKSLAEVHKELAAGVVLSGTGKDGTLGLKDIKEYGGITIAQDDQSATYNDMPKHAIDAGVVDFILPPEDIPKQLLQINGNFPKINETGKVESMPKNDESIFTQILSLLNQRSGVDFTYYKQSTIRRRIARRIGMRKKEKLSGYLKFLRSDKAEQDALFQDMLIPVTSFFRDTKTFDVLCSSIFPMLFKNREATEPVRIWIAGCSTGEEVYSIAICLHEFLGEKIAAIPIQIFASDISEVAIKKARIGIYTQADVQLLSEERKSKYFRKTEGHYEVTKVIRDMCVFAPHNFLKDPPFAKMDLISCRNVLIYLDSYLQKKALTTFHYSLKQNGYLMLGKSETVSAAADMFTLHDKHDKIYSRNSVPGRFMHVATERKEEALATKTSKNNGIGKTRQIPETLQTDFKKSGEAILLSKYTPAAVIVNEQMDIVHIHGIITPFLEPSPGKPTFNLLKMAREGLSFELRNALHKVKTTKKSFIKKDIPSITYDYQADFTSSELNDGTGQPKQQLVSIEVVPLSNTVEPYYLVLFNKTEVPAIAPLSTGKGVRSKQEEAARQRITQLEAEIAQAREDMRSISEEQEAANEELQSGNEELESSNEEMQSLNEELETSKEELQSSNEELLIVNQELFDKQEQLNSARLYSDSIVSTIRHPLIVLDKALRIKTANASFYKEFKTDAEETEGKLFYEIQNHQWDDMVMRSMLEKIIRNHELLSDFEIILNFPSIGERHLLLNGRQIADDTTAQKLVLLAIEDVTERKAAELKLISAYADTEEKNKLIEASEKRYSNILSQSPMAIAILKGPEMVVSFANEQMIGILGKGKAVINKPLLKGVPELNDQVFPKLLTDVYTSGIAFEGYEIKATIKKNSIPVEIYFNFIYQPYREVDDSITGVTVLATDVTEQVLAKQQIEESEIRFRELSASLEEKVKERTTKLQYSNEELHQTNMQLEQFAYITSHDLQEPLRKIITFSKLLQNKYPEELNEVIISYLNKIEIASSRMKKLIEDVLNYSSLLQHEKLFVQTNLNETLENILSDFDLLIQEKKAIIKIEKLPSVDAIPMQMNQLFCNLLSNALKFTKKDVPPVISISARTLSEKQIEKYPAFNPLVSYVEIIVKDNGIGFEQYYTKKIFSIFQRLHSKDAFIGTGIGLALVKKIIENHHGEIFTVAKENGGAAFHVILPISQSR